MIAHMFITSCTQARKYDQSVDTGVKIDNYQCRIKWLKSSRNIEFT